MNTEDQKQNVALNILLADDDKDDRFFFARALKQLPILTNLVTVKDGESLINYLNENSTRLPDVLFLDLNMPRKNGSECLEEIKASIHLQQLPVVIYSTSINDTIGNLLYDKGAHYYMKKTGFDELKKCLLSLFTLIAEKKFIRPSRNEFIIDLVEL